MLRYIIQFILITPLIPIIYIQGKRIKNSLPAFIEAKGREGTEGDGKKTFSLLFIGESSMAGVGVPHNKQSFAGYLSRSVAKRMPDHFIKWKVLAKNGYTANDVIEHTVPTLPSHSPDWLIVGLGANDTFQFTLPSRWKQATKELITRIRVRYPKTRITFIHLPPVKTFPAFTPLLKQLMNTWVNMLRVGLIDVVSQMENVDFISEELSFDDWITANNPTLKPVDFYSDGVHANELAYELWAEQTVKHF